MMWSLILEELLTVQKNRFRIAFRDQVFKSRVLLFSLHYGALKLPHIIFTGLEDYKARGTQASPYFKVSHYTEFEKTKDLVLVRGDIVFTSKLTDEEATWLMETTQSFYLNDVRYKLVERFNKQTNEFEFKDVLQALNMPLM